MILACDQNDNTIRIAYRNGTDEVRTEQYSVEEQAHRRLDELGKKTTRIAITQGTPLIGDLNLGTTTLSLIPRLEAVYWNYHKQVEKKDCLVLSIGVQSGAGGLIKEGCLVDPKVLGHDLSLRGIFRAYVNSDALLKRWVYLRGSNPQAQEAIFKGFLAALKGEIVYEPVPFVPPIILDSAAVVLRQVLIEMDPQKYAKSLILTDWAAFGNLPKLMKEAGYSVLVSPKDSFQDAVRGLIVWILRQHLLGPVDKAAKDSEGHGNRERDLKGQSDEVVLECLSCGTKNRITHWPEKKVAKCGACKTPLPPFKIQHIRDALTAGAYDRAVKYCEELLMEDKTNRLFQALWLLANVKLYKSIEGYAKEIDEVREWTGLRPHEKPWIVEILRLAGKEYLEKGDTGAAEKNVERAYEIDPSGEISVLSGKLQKEKGDLALRKGDLQEAQSYYKEATIRDPFNEDYPRYLSQATNLTERQYARKRSVLLASVTLVAILLVGIWFGRRVWLGRNGEEVSPPMAVTIASLRVDADKQELKVNESLKLRFVGKYSDGSEAEITRAVEWQSSDVSVATVSQEGEVEGIKVGRADITAHYGGLVSPPLSLFVTDEQLPEEVASPPDSLKTKEEPEPGTVVVASERIKDHIKVARWERDNGRYADALAELEKAKSLDPLNAEVLSELEITRRAWDAERNILGDRAAAEKSLPEAAQTEAAETWSYEAVRAAYVFERPSVSSRKVARVDKGTKITVVRPIGDWLEVRSKHGNPPGFIRRDDAKYLGRAN